MDTRNIEKEVLEALKCIEEDKNFILEGGAGSGKTYSLISLIDELTKKFPDIKIACITYTNNAVAEILSRIESKNLWVSTIHNFMWELIKKYQNEIKGVIVELINNEEKNFKKPKDFDNQLISNDYFMNLQVEYDEYYSVTPNDKNIVKITHEHVLIVAEKIFDRYKKISDILKDRVDCIFVDEYQDTSPLVADILLKHIEKSNKKIVIGFFGDSMQSIYDDSVGDLNCYNLAKIVKHQNRRNPRVIIELANNFRCDGIEQIPSEDINAPNIENGTVREGSIKFLYGNEVDDFQNVKEMDIFKSWDFSDGTQTKELRLTHRYNAEMAGFKELYNLYNSDLIITLTRRIKENINKGYLSTDKTFGDLAVELEQRSKIKDLVDQISKDETYMSIYNSMKNMLWKEVYEKCNIDKDSLMSYKLNGISRKYESNSSRDRILRRIDIIEEIIDLYTSNKMNDFLKITKFHISNHKDKIQLENAMNYLVNEEEKTIEEVLEYAEKNGLINQDELFSNYILNRGFYLWERVRKIPFKQYRKSIEYLKDFSPNSTQHSVKGSEYDNVLLILESNWNKYDFKTLFNKGSKNDNVILRTKKLFYVCITRAKKNLVIYMPTDDAEIINKAKGFFGDENVVDVSNY